MLRALAHRGAHRSASPTSCSPAASSPIERGLAFHIRERRPNGLLVGILLDDRRDAEGARHHPRRAGRDPEERAAAASWSWRTAASSATSSSSAIRTSCASTATPSTCRSFASRPAGHQVLGARALPVAADLARPQRSAVPGAAGPVPGRAARPHAGADLSVRLRGDRLCVSRRAAHHAAEPAWSMLAVIASRSRRCGLIGFASTVLGVNYPLRADAAVSR